MLYRMRDLKSRAASAENPDAEKGAGGTAGNGIKGAPAIKDFKAGSTEVVFDEKGPGQIRHIWMTCKPREPQHVRNIIIRMYWEDNETPSVEAPLTDFFGVAHGAMVPMYSDFVNMQEGRGLNCYIPMPFAKAARITLTNESETDLAFFFYQIDFTLGDAVGDEDGRFHALFRRENPCPYGHDFTILETAGAPGIYLGCIIGVRSLNPGWWGEGEVKIYLDGDRLFPTICGTGAEDYMGSAWGLGEHCTRFQGCPLHRGPYASIYRFHVPDPVYFQEDIRVTVQQMGAGMRDDAKKLFGDKLIWESKNHPQRHPEDGYFLRSDDYCSTAFWYQYPLVKTRPPFPDKELRSANLYTEEEAKRIDAEA